ncbi:MAG: enoyl-CoA hydratase-related protein [Thermoplasmata archaeon]|nr:enoyl-CoA hydratase-related protein [Thermoplasmata archaeon]
MHGSPSKELVRREQRGAIAVVTIDHPPVNVLSAEVLNALAERLGEAEADASARVVILEGAAPKAFAAGANIREMTPMGPKEAHVHGGRGQAVTSQIEALPLPVIAAVHGSCLGGGSEIAMACDFIVASEDAVFGQPEINLGVMPGWGGTQRLPRRIGTARARAWIYLGHPIPAAVALEDGLVYEVVPRAELSNAAMRLAGELATKSALGLAAAKYAIQHAVHPSLREGLEYELSLWQQLFGTPDQRAGMAAFLEKKAWTPADRTEWARDSAAFPWGIRPERARGRREPEAKGMN